MNDLDYAKQPNEELMG